MAHEVTSDFSARVTVLRGLRCLKRLTSPSGEMPRLVIIHHPHVSTASLSKRGGGFRGTYRPTCIAASTLSLWVLRGQRGAWAPCISNILGL